VCYDPLTNFPMELAAVKFLLANKCMIKFKGTTAFVIALKNSMSTRTLYKLIAD